MKDRIYEYFKEGFLKAVKKRKDNKPRVGAELKFPLVKPDGSPADREDVDALWQYLAENGWTPSNDPATGNVIGAEKPGEQNNTIASCETGYCKTEFSMAHVANLNDLVESIEKLREELAPFANKRDLHFLAYGIHPVARPGKYLLMKKSRSGVWDRIFKSNRHIPEEDGDDMHLFTINAACHVHIDVSFEDSIRAVNALNGFVGGQLALTAHSNIWKGELDPNYKCVAEQFWSWWIPEADRIGVPDHPFEDMRDYARTIAGFRPVFIRREGKPILLPNYGSFEEYFYSEEAIGEDMDGNEVKVTPNTDDIDLHTTCYWYNTRLSRYWTVENRANDEQPPEELQLVSALTLGVVSALDEAEEALERYDWQDLRRARDLACKNGLEKDEKDSFDLKALASDLLEVAEAGLRKRGMGEEIYLAPLEKRLEKGRCPADDAADIFRKGGVEALVESRAL